ALDSCLQGISEAAERVLIEVAHFAPRQLDAGDLDGVISGGACAPAGGPRNRHRELRLQLRHFTCEPLAVGLQPLDGLDRLVLVNLQRADDAIERGALLLRPRDSAGAGHRFDPADALGDAALSGNREEPDVSGRGY